MSFDGTTLAYQYRFPSLSTPWSLPEDIKVKGLTRVSGLEISGLQLYSMDINAGTIAFDFDRSAVWANAQRPAKGGSSTPASFNGPVLQDVYDDILPIVSVTMDTNIRGLTKTDLKFDQNSISIDFSGMLTTEYSYIKLKVTFQKSVVGTDRNETLSGTSDSEYLFGGKGNDLIKAGGGADTIEGGAGIDRMYGENGADRFVFKSPKDMGTVGSKTDTIYDFTAADIIDLSKIDANSKVAGDQGFSFIGTKAFGGHAGELRFEKKASDTYIYGDTNGDKKTDFALHLDDAVTMVPGFFLL